MRTMMLAVLTVVLALVATGAPKPRMKAVTQIGLGKPAYDNPAKPTMARVTLTQQLAKVEKEYVSTQNMVQDVTQPFISYSVPFATTQGPPPVPGGPATTTNIIFEMLPGRKYMVVTEMNYTNAAGKPDSKTASGNVDP